MMNDEDRKNQLSGEDLSISQDEKPDKEPQVYAIKRKGSGWALNRRDFLTAAAAASAGAVAGCGVTSQIIAKGRGKYKNVFAHIDSVKALAISPDSKLLASGSGDNTIKLWSLPEGSLLKTLEGHSISVYAIAISPDSTLLASGNSDETICLWSIPDGKFKMCLLDLAASPKKTKGIQYKVRNEKGMEITYTLPCGSPIPPGAVCVCNYVPGSLTVPTYTPHGGGQHCTCVPVHYWYPN